MIFINLFVKFQNVLKKKRSFGGIYVILKT